MTITPEQLEAASKDELLIEGFTKLAALGSFSVGTSGGADLINALMRAERQINERPSTDMVILERLRELFPQAESEEINELYVNTLAVSLNEFVADLPD